MSQREQHSSESAERRRWTLQGGIQYDGEWCISGPFPEAAEAIEVMPVSEHEVLREAAREVLDAPRGYERVDAMERLRAVLDRVGGS